MKDIFNCIFPSHAQCHSERSEESRSDCFFQLLSTGHRTTSLFCLTQPRARFLAALGMTWYPTVARGLNFALPFKCELWDYLGSQREPPVPSKT
jgi:hypothetical protein